ncbi:MAG: aspartate carbamoyltransferase catalytic subunit [Deltaproteobacteria bacterium]|nr:aspartate carbamoyltransferase catalytic subunit [Deltaproteobacteria bacterium]
MKLSLRHLLSVRDLTKRDVELILETSRSFKGISERDIKKVPTLRGRTVVNAFFEDSTRTRLSFEIAEKRLSADTVNFSISGSSMAKKGESFIDTIRNIEAMKPDIFVIRHSQAGAAAQAAKLIHGRVVNAGDGQHEHPTQALLDLFTIREQKGRLKGLKVGIVGDIAHSRVARSDIVLFQKMGMEVSVAGPATFMPFGIEDWNVKVFTDVRAMLPQLDVVMALRIQRERMGEQFFPNEREYARFFGINQAALHEAKESLVIMHPGPVNRGVELSTEVIDGPRSVILDQVTNGVAVRMAILYLLLGDTKEM